MSPSEPIVAVATAPGRGAVGIVRLSGPPGAIAAIGQALLGRSLNAREATYLPFPAADGEPIDQGLAIHFPAPRSYTGEDVLELQAHGGPVVLQLLLARCLELGRAHGLRLARPGEFTERAFLNDKLDLAQAEAVADLIDASTEAAARSASRSLSGAFSVQVNALRDALVHLRTWVEAHLDFPEEEIGSDPLPDIKIQLLKIEHMQAQLMQRAHQGVLLQGGIKVVIAGQPNVGKSSLLNALAGAELAIVTPIAGTTRDVVSQTIQIEGVPLHVVDTAGLRETVDEVERLGIERAWGQIEGADAVLLLQDLTRLDCPEYSAHHQQLSAGIAAKTASRVPVLTLWNKRDQAAPAALQRVPPGDDRHLVVSAKTGDGIAALRQRLLQLVGWQTTGSDAFIARERHLDALHRCAAHAAAAHHHLAPGAVALDLLAEELRLAQHALNEITGAFSADDLLGAIFANFCIGK